MVVRLMPPVGVKAVELEFDLIMGWLVLAFAFNWNAATLAAARHTDNSDKDMKDARIRRAHRWQTR
jgi:hypothetical protein